MAAPLLVLYEASVWIVHFFGAKPFETDGGADTLAIIDMAKQILVIATRNSGKSAEIKEMLKDFPVLVKDLNDFGPIPEPVEDGETFEENAYKKASFTSKVLGLPALADDSGLQVETLWAPRVCVRPVMPGPGNRSREQHKTSYSSVRKGEPQSPVLLCSYPWLCLRAPP